MHDIVAFLKGAVDDSDTAGVYACYVVREGCIYAYNGTLQAGLPFDGKVAFNIPAAELNRALDRMSEIQTLTIKDGTVRIKAGRLSATIRCNTEEAQPPPAMPEEWQDSPPGLCAALALAKPFMDNDQTRFTSCTRLMTGRVTAMNGVNGIDVAVKGLELEHPILLTAKVVEFLIAQGDPDGLHLDENYLLMSWEDGRWARAQLYHGAMANTVDQILENAGKKAPVAMDAAWREAYADASGLSANDAIQLTSTSLNTKNDRADGVVEHETKGLPKDHTTYWTLKALNPVVAIAQAWNPASYPAPSLFTGPGFRGVVLGRNRW